MRKSTRGSKSDNISDCHSFIDSSFRCRFVSSLCNDVSGVRVKRLLLVLLLPLLLRCESEQTGSASGVQTASEEGVYFSSNRSGNYEVYTLQDNQLDMLTANVGYDSWWPRQSPDAKSMLFYRSLVSDRPEQGGHNNNYSNASLWTLDLQTSVTTELIAKGANDWRAQGAADWSPDGSQLVMAAIEGSTDRWHLFVTDASGANPVNISS